ncbi:MAG: hypothetical protein JWN34_1481 [Bryobacterales bacterium]|nr:hypothetical protein [Bryobacterales bacterium]
MEAGFEAAERGEDDAVVFAGVSPGHAVEVVIRFGGPSLRVVGGVGPGGGELVFVDGLFHAIDAEKAPFIDGKFVDEVTFGEVAGPKVGAGGFDEGGEPVYALGSDGEDLEVDVKGGRREVVVGVGWLILHAGVPDRIFSPGA